LPITPELDATITIFFACVSLLYLFLTSSLTSYIRYNKDYVLFFLKEEPFLTAKFIVAQVAEKAQKNILNSSAFFFLFSCVFLLLFFLLLASLSFSCFFAFCKKTLFFFRVAFRSCLLLRHTKSHHRRRRTNASSSSSSHL